MPAGSRIRANNVYGTTSDNPLLIGATSFTSLGLSLLPAVSGDHAVVVLDPKRVFGEPEIVVVTAHLALGTTATITRGTYGTAAREHPQDTAWAHVPVDEDWIEVLTAGTRPSDPYEGQFIFETDTNKLVGYGGVDWAPRDAGGQLAYAQVVAGQTGLAAGVDLTGLTVTLTPPTGRRIQITGYVHFQGSVAGELARLDILDGSGTLLNLWQGRLETSGVGFIAKYVSTPTAAPITYKLRGIRTTGGGTLQLNASAVNPAFILVEDLGAA